MGGKKSNAGQPMEYFTLKGKADEANTPHFTKSEKVGNEWKTVDTFDTMVGAIVGAEIVEKKFKDGNKKFFVLTMDDEGARCLVTMSHNKVSYLIINSLSSCINKLAIFSIRVYKGKPKVAENGKTYINGGAEVLKEGEKTTWHINPADAPKPIAVMLGANKPFLKDGKQVYDHTDAEAFWEKIFKTCIEDKVGSGRSNNPAPAAATTGSDNNTGTFTPPADGDDLPF